MPQVRCSLFLLLAAVTGFLLSACVAGRVSPDQRRQITKLHVAWELGDGIQYVETSPRPEAVRAKIGPCAELEGFVAAVTQALQSRGYVLSDKEADASHVLVIRAFPMPLNKDVRDHGIVFSALASAHPDIKVLVNLKYEIILRSQPGSEVLLNTVFETGDHGYVKANGKEAKWSDYSDVEKQQLLTFVGTLLKREAEALVAWTGL